MKIVESILILTFVIYLIWLFLSKHSNQSNDLQFIGWVKKIDNAEDTLDHDENQKIYGPLKYYLYFHTIQKSFIVFPIDTYNIKSNEFYILNETNIKNGKVIEIDSIKYTVIIDK